jgi:hypothetical protein
LRGRAGDFCENGQRPLSLALIGCIQLFAAPFGFAPIGVAPIGCVFAARRAGWKAKPYDALQLAAEQAQRVLRGFQLRGG